ncbi:hypothetical protein COV19_03600 [Candidatus Woesearchaeota archaeon CG10_big_fil_rev_8_21_14_0_10_44_13]|nr:MAG: hypothetical protein COV19_03600 [Candidatus Woesearchaeota archaeon CG10_big_fil_rev_8_21_14_0_10_44_13]
MKKLSLDEILAMNPAEAVRQDPEIMEAFYRLSWDEVMQMGFDQAAKVADIHERIFWKGTKEQIDRIADMHAYEVLPKFREKRRKKIKSGLDIFNYLKKLKEEGELNPVVFDSVISDEKKALSFQRIIRTNTHKYYAKGGLLFETAIKYPNGFVVREFSSFYSDDETRKIAEAAQRFYHSAAGYAKNILSRDGPAEHERYLLDKISLLETINPLDSAKGMIHNVYVGGRDMKDELSAKNPSVDERVKYLEEITSIDLIMGYFANEFRKTEDGRKLYRKPGIMGSIRRKSLFKPLDSRIYVAEKILIPTDHFLKEVLTDKRIIRPDGRIKDPKAFSVFYDEGTDLAMIFELIGIGEGKTFPMTSFCVGDFNLGNMMVKDKDGKRAYTAIDFDSSREDSIVSALFKRWANAGIFDIGEPMLMSDSKKAEDHLLDSAYKTLDMLTRCSNGVLPSKEDFLEEYRTQKKIYLLYKAKRYRSLESKDSNPEKMRCFSRYYFTLFVKELIKEGKIDDKDPYLIDYIARIFGKPFSDREMKGIKVAEDPDFASHEEISPLAFRDLDREISQQIRKYRIDRIKDRAKKFGLVGLVISVLTGLGTSTYFYHNKTADLAEDKEMAEWIPLFKYLNNSATNGLPDYHKYKRFSIYEEMFGDRMTAMAACVDLFAVYDAAKRAGLQIPYEVIEDYRGASEGSKRNFILPYDSIEPYLEEYHPKVSRVVNNSSPIIMDSWMFTDAYKIQKEEIKKLSSEARQNLDAQNKGKGFLPIR